MLITKTQSGAARRPPLQVLLWNRLDYQLAPAAASASVPEQFAAQKVEVTGTLYQKTGVIKVDNIRQAK